MKDEALPPDDDDLDDTIQDEDAEDLLWEEGDPVDRRKDPLRKPGS
jgi:hypothetical protein